MLQTEFEGLCKVQIFEEGDVVECLEERAELCKLNLCLGLIIFVNARPEDILLRTLTNELSDHTPSFILRCPAGCLNDYF